MTTKGTVARACCAEAVSPHFTHIMSNQGEYWYMFNIEHIFTTDCQCHATKVLYDVSCG